MPSTDTTARASSWSRYWASGVRHSCTATFDGHYGDAIAAFWGARLQEMAADDVVLEVGCGNGSLIRFMQDVSLPALPAEIHAVDLAQVDSSWLEQLRPELRERVVLHAGAEVSSVPLQAGEVTRVFSQYALEYFATEHVWSALEEMLAPNACLAAIIHHKDSRLSQVSSAESQHFDWLLQADGPLDCAQRILPLLAAVGTPNSQEKIGTDPAAERKRADFNRIYRALDARAQASSFGDVLHDVAQQVMRVLKESSTVGEAVASDALADLRRRVVDNRLRVAELVQCALDRSGVEAWVARLREAGFEHFDLNEVNEQGYLFGWSLVARR